MRSAFASMPRKAPRFPGSGGEGGVFVVARGVVGVEARKSRFSSPRPESSFSRRKPLGLPGIGGAVGFAVGEKSGDAPSNPTGVGITGICLPSGVIGDARLFFASWWTG